jgi:hypothetical protein
MGRKAVHCCEGDRSERQQCGSHQHEAIVASSG